MGFALSGGMAYPTETHASVSRMALSGGTARAIEAPGETAARGATGAGGSARAGGAAAASRACGGSREAAASPAVTAPP